MYRMLFTVILCVSTVLAAPQNNSNITFVKQITDTTLPQHEATRSTRDSRVDHLPLTIPGNVTDDNKSAATKNTEPDTPPPTKATTTKTYNYSDRIYSIKTKPKVIRTTTESELAVQVPNSTASISEAISPSESKQTDTFAKAENSTVEYETTPTESDIESIFVTEKYEGELTIQTDVNDETTKAPPASFLPKLSYYGKSSLGSFSHNLIAPSSKRRFRSRCRCERIWNCAKLQISVPRCPEEYFMCCA